MKEEIDCPGCGDKIKLKPKHQTHEVELDLGQQTQVMEPPKPESKKLTHEEMGDLMPKGLNFMTCPGGDCGHQKIKNPNQTKKFKTCPNGNCGANTVPKGSDYCPTCGKGIDEDSDLEDGVIFEENEE